MAKLDAAERKKLPKADFAGPGKSYPIENAAHAVAAKARATQQEKKGNLSPSTKAKIDAKADKKLGEKGGKPKSEAKPMAGHGISRAQLQEHGLHTSKHFGGKGEF